MPHLLLLCLVPVIPLCCLGLVLWLDRLEETLDRDVSRRRRRVSASQVQLEESLAGSTTAAEPASPSGRASEPSPVSVPLGSADLSLGGSTNL